MCADGWKNNGYRRDRSIKIKHTLQLGTRYKVKLSVRKQKKKIWVNGSNSATGNYILYVIVNIIIFPPKTFFLVCPITYMIYLRKKSIVFIDKLFILTNPKFKTNLKVKYLYFMLVAGLIHIQFKQIVNYHIITCIKGKFIKKVISQVLKINSLVRQ